ncbi:MAG: SAV_915 family protein [Motilibacteraceae bacterium]
MPTADPAAVLLCCPAVLDPGGAVRLPVALAPDGRRAVLAYTGLDALLAGCGEQAGWVRLTALDLQQLIGTSDEVDTVWLDPAGPVVGRQGAPAGQPVRTDVPAPGPHR